MEVNINRSVMNRVMVGVAGLAVLGMTATSAGAQTDDSPRIVKQKPQLITYESYWAFPPAHWGDVDKDNATANQKVLAPALADGTLVGYGDDENLAPPEGGFTHGNWWKANSWADFIKSIEAFHKAGGSSSLVSSTQHWSQRYVSYFYNWKAGSRKGAYEYRLTYKVRPGVDPDDATLMLSSFYVPLYEKLLADGTIVEYEIDRESVHSAGSPGQIIFTFVTPNTEGLDKFRAAYNGIVVKDSLILAVKASVFVDECAPHADWLLVNATYK
jgi:hypothetical protein